MPEPTHLLGTVRLKDGRNVRVFAPTDDLWLCLSSIKNNPDPTKPLAFFDSIVAHCCDGCSFDCSLEDRCGLILAILGTWDLDRLPAHVAFWHDFARAELVRFVGETRRVNALVSLATQPHPEYRERISRGAAWASKEYALALGRAQDALRSSPTAPSPEGRRLGPQRIAPAHGQRVTCSKADVGRFLAPGGDPDNTKLVDRAAENGRLTLEPAAHPIGKRKYDVRFTDPEEHARFERRMGIDPRCPAPGASPMIPDDPR